MAKGDCLAGRSAGVLHTYGECMSLPDVREDTDQMECNNGEGNGAMAASTWGAAGHLMDWQSSQDGRSRGNAAFRQRSKRPRPGHLGGWPPGRPQASGLLPDSGFVATPDERLADIHKLPEDVLIRIFKLLDPSTWRHVLPLVCRAWAELLGCPLVLYNHMDVDINAELRSLNPGAKVYAAHVTRWLSGRAHSIWSLRFRNLNHTSIRHPALTPTPPPSHHDFNGYKLALVLQQLLWLQELVIEDCHTLVTTETFEAIGHLQNLKVLCLKGIRRELDGADFKALIKLRRLEELVLDCDQAPPGEPGVEEMKWGLQGFPEGMEHLVNMTHLTLSCHPGITDLPLSLAKLTKLQVLNLDFCNLRDLPACVGELTSLTTLDVEGNMQLGGRCRESPFEQPRVSFGLHNNLEHLSNLRYLNLNACGLRSIPKVLSGFHCLQTLDLEENELGDLQTANWAPATSWTALKCLNIATCRLTELPQPLLSLSSLRILDLTNNLLTNDGLPDGLSALSQLKAIGLKRNRLKEVPPVLGTLTALQEIYLEDNVRLEVHRSLDFLAELPYLRILMMGKGTPWAPASVHYLSELMRKLTRKHPTRDILRISYPGNAEWETPFQGE